MVSPITYCFPSGGIQKAVKSPYSKFNGSFSFVITVLGTPLVGKSSLCQQLKSQCVDIQPKHLFRFISVQPEFQVSLTASNQTYNLGVYDSLGFDDVELLKYLLEGQHVSRSADSFSMVSVPPLPATQTEKDTKKKQKRKLLRAKVFWLCLMLTIFEASIRLVNLFKKSVIISILNLTMHN